MLRTSNTLHVARGRKTQACVGRVLPCQASAERLGKRYRSLLTAHAQYADATFAEKKPASSALLTKTFVREGSPRPSWIEDSLLTSGSWLLRDETFAPGHLPLQNVAHGVHMVGSKYGNLQDNYTVVPAMSAFALDAQTRHSRESRRIMLSKTATTEAGALITHVAQHGHEEAAQQLSYEHQATLCMLPASFVGVYSGHWGPATAARVAGRLHRTVGQDTRFWDATIPAALTTDVTRSEREAVEGAFARWYRAQDAACIRAQQEEHHRQRPVDGATGVTGLQVGLKLYCASVGGCRAVLARGGEPHLLTHPHSDNAPAAFGYVTHKLCAEPKISCTPGVTVTALQPGRDTCVIYGSEGLWGWVTPQQAVSVANTYLRATANMSAGVAAHEAAAALVRLAKKQGCLGDATAVVSYLSWQ